LTPNSWSIRVSLPDKIEACHPFLGIVLGRHELVDDGTAYLNYAERKAQVKLFRHVINPCHEYSFSQSTLRTFNPRPVIELGDFVPPRLRSLAVLVEWLKLVTSSPRGLGGHPMHFHPAATDATWDADRPVAPTGVPLIVGVGCGSQAPAGAERTSDSDRGRYEAGCGSQPLRGNSRSRKLTATRSGTASGQQRDSKVPTTRPGASRAACNRCPVRTVDLAVHVCLFNRKGSLDGTHDWGETHVCVAITRRPLYELIADSALFRSKPPWAGLASRLCQRTLCQKLRAGEAELRTRCCPQAPSHRLCRATW